MVENKTLRDVFLIVLILAILFHMVIKKKKYGSISLQITIDIDIDNSKDKFKWSSF